MSKYINVTKAAEILGVCTKTLRKWDDEGVLKAYKTPKGHRRYIQSELDALVGRNTIVPDSSSDENKVYIYARVSTKKQQESGNLTRQIERLKSYCDNKQYNIECVYQEVASGINENRTQLNRMLANLKHINKIVVEYPDRLARFGLNYIKLIAQQNNVEIEFIENNEIKSSNEEMADDIVSIITCFSARLYGARGERKVKKVLDELENSKND